MSGRSIGRRILATAVRVSPGVLVVASLLLVGFAVPASAEEASIVATVEARKVGVDDRFQLSVTVRGGGAGDEPQLPPFENLKLVGGPSIANQISFVNGVMASAKTWTYVVQAQSVGRAKVGAFRLPSGAASTPIEIEVVAGSLRPQRRPDPVGDPFGGDPFERFFGREQQPRAEPKLFVEAVPSRSKLHVGEPLRLDFFLYTQTSITGVELVGAPKFPGFWSEELEKSTEAPKGEAANVGGEQYRRFLLFQKLLYPTKAGKETIPAVTLKLGVPRRSGFFFDPVASSGEAIERLTKPVTITVDPLPEQAGYSGAVGRFRVISSVDKTTLGIGDAATLRFVVEGSGNLKLVDQGPELALKGARVYPPQVKSEFKTTPQGVSGSRTWEYVIVPETAGTIEIPALAFQWFDPDSNRLETGTSPAAKLVVAGVAAGASGAALPAVQMRTLAPRGSMSLRGDLDPASPDPLRPNLLLGCLAAAFVLHALLLARGAGLRLPGIGGGGHPRARKAAAEIEKGFAGESKESAAAKVERALVEAFGEPPAEAATERDRDVAAVLREARELRYAPQLGDYTHALGELSRQAASTLRRWG